MSYFKYSDNSLNLFRTCCYIPHRLLRVAIWWLHQQSRHARVHVDQRSLPIYMTHTLFLSFLHQRNKTIQLYSYTTDYSLLQHDTPEFVRRRASFESVVSDSKLNGNSVWQKILGLIADPRVDPLMGRLDAYSYSTRLNTVKKYSVGRFKI